MDQTQNHRIFICTSCRHSGGVCRPGYALIEQLGAAVAMAGEAISDDFEINGVAGMAGCETPCTVGYRASKKAGYLFGDIEPDQDIGVLVAFAGLYREHGGGWLYPGKLRPSALVRVPSMILAIQICDETPQ